MTITNSTQEDCINDVVVQAQVMSEVYEYEENLHHVKDALYFYGAHQGHSEEDAIPHIEFVNDIRNIIYTAEQSKKE